MVEEEEKTVRKRRREGVRVGWKADWRREVRIVAFECVVPGGFLVERR